MAAAGIEPAIAALLGTLGKQARGFRVDPLSASGNNRIFMVRTDDERLAAKWYYDDPGDPRDRLRVEYAFIEHGWRMGLRCMPRPCARDPASHLALYEFIEGEKLGPLDIDGESVMEAARFLARLNSAESRALAQSLPPASEACFSVTEHLRMIEDRISRLASIAPAQEVDKKAAGFVRRLATRWKQERARILAGCSSLGIDADRPIPPGQRCLSPSDFGFHNVLRRSDGSLCFLDFEYAGWDDPAKTIGDFFSHPGVPVPRRHFDVFLSAVTTSLPDPLDSAARSRLLEPLFRLKWCCIILNEFLPQSAKRRRFADPHAGTERHKASQLAKAVNLFDSLEN